MQTSTFEWQTAIDAAFDGYITWMDSVASGEPYGTVIVRHGKIVCEHYGSGADGKSAWEMGSIRKSVTSALLGMAIEEDKLSLDTIVADIWPDIHQITGNEKDKQITMRDLAVQVSGWMTDKTPGEQWLYNNAACTAGGIVLGKLYGMTDCKIAPLVKERIADAIAASSWECYHYDDEFVPGKHGPTGPKLAIDTNMRDMAKFGHLWLRNGQWHGNQLVPEWYVREATANQAGNQGGHYGYWWFTNDGKATLPDAPEDCFYHLGNGRPNRRTVCLVCPSLDLVAVAGTSKDRYDLTKEPPWQVARTTNEWISKILHLL